jgi:hypothetical protein
LALWQCILCDVVLWLLVFFDATTTIDFAQWGIDITIFSYRESFMH